MSANTQNITAFKADLREFQKKTELTYNQIVRWVVSTIWTKITDRTPVETGRARASWNIAVGAPNPRVPRKPKKGQSVKKPENPNFQNASAIKRGESIFVTSNLDYIEYLEAGSSDQAAGGMVQISIAEVEVEVNNAINQL